LRFDPTHGSNIPPMGIFVKPLIRMRIESH
jgi:hypothetical protein